MVNTLAPFTDEFAALRQAMDRLLGEAFVAGPPRAAWARGENAVRPMPLDVYGTADEVVILAAVPGLRPEQLEVTAFQNTVTVSGTVADPGAEAEATGATWFLREIPRGQFRRSVTLPFEIDAGQARASFEHGVVRIVLPKAAQAKPTKIAVQAGSTPAIGAGSQAG